MTAIKLFLLVVSLTAVSFGGGNSLLAGLERELVGPGVITPSQFAAGMALGQATPGPLASFTTAIGRSAAGWTGAVAATLALLVVSWIAVQLITRVPKAWFSQPAVRTALAAVTLYAMALVLFLAYRIVQAGDHTRLLAPVGIMLLVMVARMLKAPTAVLMVVGITLGMLVQGTTLAGW